MWVLSYRLCSYSAISQTIPIPPVVLNLWAQSLPFLMGVLCLHSWPFVVLHSASSSPSPFPPHLLMSSGSCCLIMGTILRVYESPGRLHSLAISRPRPHPRATRSYRRRSAPPPPPGVLLIPYPSVLLVRDARAQQKYF